MRRGPAGSLTGRASSSSHTRTGATGFAVDALARTAAQLREDAEAFAEMIDEIIEDVVEHAEAGISLSVGVELEGSTNCFCQRGAR